MGGVSEADVAAAIGRIDEIIIREIVRTGASRPELRRALALAKGPGDLDAERPCRHACSASSICWR